MSPTNPAAEPITNGALVESLDRLDVALAANVERSNEARRRLAGYRIALVEGTPLRDLLHAEERPRTVELLTANHATLESVGAQYRSEMAHALRREGETIDAIAELFGVTRQRISALLRQPSRHRSANGS
jgi:hypothetical protein